MYMVGKFARVIEKDTRDNLRQSTQSARSNPPKMSVDGDEQVSMGKPSNEETK